MHLDGVSEPMDSFRELSWQKEPSAQHRVKERTSLWTSADPPQRIGLRAACLRGTHPKKVKTDTEDAGPKRSLRLARPVPNEVHRHVVLAPPEGDRSGTQRWFEGWALIVLSSQRAIYA